MKTTSTRTLTITDSHIRVASKTHPDCAVYHQYRYEHRVTGILPGCRKPVLLSVSPMSGCIWVKPLFGHAGNAHIKPEEWAALVKNSPVRSCDLFPVDVTPAIAEGAIEDALAITTCLGVTNREHVHPGYQPTYDGLVVA